MSVRVIWWIVTQLCVIEVINNAVANQVVGFLVDGVALSERILDFPSAVVRIKLAEQTNTVWRNTKLANKQVRMELLHHEELTY